MPEWSTVITAVSIPTSIAVYGNGKTMGITNGTKTGGLNYNSGSNAISTSTEALGKEPGVVSGSTKPFTTSHQNLGLTTATNGNSGIVAKSDSITKTSQTYNFCIKY